MPFTTTEERLTAAKTPRATGLSSAQIKRAWTQRIRDEAVYGARITSRAYVDAIKKRLVEVIGGTLSPQEAERRLKETLRDLGYSPERGFGDGKVPAARAGDIRDLSSSRRIQLIIDTNVKRARSMGQVAASENPLTLMSLPAWKLTRTGARKKPRGNWLRRWAEAGAACGWKGALKRQMVALKTSPIWEKLGNGAGGFDDCIGSPYPPFAFGSGMAWVNVGRKDWQRMCKAEGVDDGLEAVAAKAQEFAKTERASALAPSRPQTVAVDIPAAAAPMPSGAGNPLTSPPAAPVQASYAPDYRSRNRADAAIDAAIDAIDRLAADVSRWRMEAGDDDADAEDGRLSGMAGYQQELSSLKGRVVNYGSAVQTTPAPRNRAEQEAYDAKMARYADAAARTAKKARYVHAAARTAHLSGGRP